MFAMHLEEHHRGHRTLAMKSSLHSTTGMLALEVAVTANPPFANTYGLLCCLSHTMARGTPNTCSRNSAAAGGGSSRGYSPRTQAAGASVVAGGGGGGGLVGPVPTLAGGGGGGGGFNNIWGQGGAVGGIASNFQPASDAPRATGRRAMHAPGGKTSWSPYGHVGQVCTQTWSDDGASSVTLSTSVYATRQASEHMYDNSNKIGGASSGIPASSRTNLPPRAPRYCQAPDTLPFHEYSCRR